MSHDGQRHRGGLWCQEVLARLPDLVEGELADADRRAVEEHLAGCDWCERFGGAYAATVRGVRASLAPAPVPDDVGERLARRLAAELEADSGER